MDEMSRSAGRIESSIIADLPKTALVKFEGHIQTLEARKLKEVFADVDEQGAKRVVLDMRRVTYVSSATLGLLVTYSNKRKTEEGCDAVVIVGLPKSTRNVLETLGLLPMFVLFDDMNSALTSLGVTNAKPSDR